MYEQANNYLNESNLLYKYQSVLFASDLADTCPSYVQVKIVEGFDTGIYTGMIVDLHKAFRTINDNILSDNKLRAIFLSSPWNGLNHSFLTELSL